MNHMLYGYDGPEWEEYLWTEEDYDRLERDQEMYRDYLNDIS